jgi:hypothetical protein
VAIERAKSENAAKLKELESKKQAEVDAAVAESKRLGCVRGWFRTRCRQSIAACKTIAKHFHHHSFFTILHRLFLMSSIFGYFIPFLARINVETLIVSIVLLLFIFSPSPPPPPFWPTRKITCHHIRRRSLSLAAALSLI